MRNDLNYVERFLVSISAGSGFVSVSAFASLIGVPVGIESLAVGIKLLEITAKNLSHQEKPQLSREKTKKSDLIFKANRSFISKALCHSDIIYKHFVSVNNVLREYNKMKEDIKNPKNAADYPI